MAFILHNSTTLCAHRIAGRLLAREAGLGCISIAELAALMGLHYRFGGWT